MPGGKITIKSDIPDLESFLARKRFPLDKWLLARNITSIEAFKALTSSGKWVVSEALANSVEELLKPVPVPAKAIAPVVEVLPVVVEEPVQVAMAAVEEPKQEVESQVVLTGEDSVVSPIEEVVPHVVEETSLVSVNSYKERKKTR
jgi:hypothetical protein